MARTLPPAPMYWKPAIMTKNAATMAETVAPAVSNASKVRTIGSVFTGEKDLLEGAVCARAVTAGARQPGPSLTRRRAQGVPKACPRCAVGQAAQDARVRLATQETDQTCHAIGTPGSGALV